MGVGQKLTCFRMGNSLLNSAKLGIRAFLFFEEPPNAMSVLNETHLKGRLSWGLGKIQKKGFGFS